MEKVWVLSIPKGDSDMAIRNTEGQIRAVYNTAMQDKVWELGAVLRTVAHGGFFVRLERILDSDLDLYTYPGGCWVLAVRPLVGRTVAEELCDTYRDVLKGTTKMEPVEIALHVAAFSRRAMDIVAEVERRYDSSM